MIQPWNLDNEPLEDNRPRRVEAEWDAELAAAGEVMGADVDRRSAWDAHLHRNRELEVEVARLREQEATIQRLIAQADEMGREIERLRKRVAEAEADANFWANR